MSLNFNLFYHKYYYKHCVISFSLLMSFTFRFQLFCEHCNLNDTYDLYDFGKTVRPIFGIQSVKKDIQVLIFCFKNIILHVLTPSWIMIIFFC